MRNNWNKLINRLPETLEEVWGLYKLKRLISSNKSEHNCTNISSDKTTRNLRSSGVINS